LYYFGGVPGFAARGYWSLFRQIVAMEHLVSFQPPADYPNYLASPQPERRPLSSARWLLLALVLLCLVPRAMMALRIPSVCPDGVLYIHRAQAVEAGDLRTAFQDSLNVYPVILAALHRVGIEWELAAALWGVAISSLVVLPLWGWVRRQFDDRVALVACLLYIVQPKMIEWSPEIMRDQTFWFLFTLAIYWMWRAVTEVRYGYFLATGAAITLGSLARVEGLFLLMPLVLWTFFRSMALQTGRRKLLVGAVLCVLVFPLLLVLINLGWVCSRSGWASIYLSPLARIRPWLEFVLGRDAGDGGDGPPLRLGRMIWVFFPTMTRGLAPVFALLMFGGMWRWRKVWSRRDHQVLFCTAVVIMCGIWIQLWFDRTICPRYALPIVLMASPWAAMGMLDLTARLARIAERFHRGKRGQYAVMAAVATIVVAINFVDAMTSNTKYFEARRMAENLGYWVQREFAAPPVLVGPMDITPIVSYYSHSSPYQTFRWEAGDDTILKIVTESNASVVLLPPGKVLKPQRCRALVDRMKSLGLEPVVPGALPPASFDLYVLVRNQKNPHLTSVQRCTTTDR
jgi:hypothetical protein